MRASATGSREDPAFKRDAALGKSWEAHCRNEASSLNSSRSASVGSRAEGSRGISTSQELKLTAQVPRLNSGERVISQIFAERIDAALSPRKTARRMRSLNCSRFLRVDA
eukprot:7680045-Alexandrium_andersonii.AAC.1